MDETQNTTAQQNVIVDPVVMKRIDLLIDHCDECPYYNKRLDQCNKNMGNLESFDTCVSIPGWCHLPNYL